LLHLHPVRRLGLEPLLVPGFLKPLLAQMTLQRLTDRAHHWPLVVH